MRGKVRGNSRTGSRHLLDVLSSALSCESGGLKESRKGSKGRSAPGREELSNAETTVCWLSPGQPPQLTLSPSGPHLTAALVQATGHE